MRLVKQASYSQRQIEARAARLQAIVDDWHGAPVEWVENIRMEVWALRLAVALVKTVEMLVRLSARSNGVDLTMEQLGRMRDQMMTDILNGDLAQHL